MSGESNGPMALAAEEAKLSKKERKRLLGGNRTLDPWERYRALNDAMDEAYELIDLANRGARFALIIMGALNAALFVAGMRSNTVEAIPPGARPWIGAVLVVYALVALYFFVQAIEALRPRKFRPRLPDSMAAGSESHPAGVRYYEDVICRDAEGHWKAWREVRVEQLNAELALQGHSLCLSTQAKFTALRRLYAGLRIMTVLVAALLMLLGFFAFGGEGGS